MGTVPRVICGCCDSCHRMNVSGRRPSGRPADQGGASHRSEGRDRTEIRRHVTPVTLLRRTTAYASSIDGRNGRPTWEAAHVKQQPAIRNRTLRYPRVHDARRAAAGARLRGSPLAARMGAAQRRRLTSSRSVERRRTQSAFLGHHPRGRHPSPWRMQGSGANPWLRMRKSKRPSDRCGPFARAAGKFTMRSCALMRVQPSRRQNLRRSRNIGGEPSFERTRRSKLPRSSAAQVPWRPEDIFPPRGAASRKRANRHRMTANRHPEVNPTASRVGSSQESPAAGLKKF